MSIVFDFKNISSKKEFYKEFKTIFNLDQELGNNLDAIYDILTGMIDLPVEINFKDVSLEQLEKFEDIINLFEEVESELGDDDFTFRVFMLSE